MKERLRRISGWLAALLAVVLVLASLAGCGAGGEPQSSMAETVAESAAGSAAETAAEHPGGTETEALPEEPSPGLTEGAESSQEPAPVKSAESGAFSEASESEQAEVEEDGTYTSKEEVAQYLHLYGRLPSNFITKKEAEALGWKQKEGKAGQLDVVAPGKSIGGSRYGNYEGLLPEKDGRRYYECDINYTGGNRGAERLVYSDDGLIFYTGDHYKSFEQLYP